MEPHLGRGSPAPRHAWHRAGKGARTLKERKEEAGSRQAWVWIVFAPLPCLFKPSMVFPLPARSSRTPRRGGEIQSPAYWSWCTRVEHRHGSLSTTGWEFVFWHGKRWLRYGP